MDIGLAASLTLTRWAYVQGEILMPSPSQMEDGVGLCHARWMLETVMKEATTWKNDKLNRWLGYAQALLVQAKVLSLEEVKRCNLQA
jgi:hypothetical protein